MQEALSLSSWTSTCQRQTQVFDAAPAMIPLVPTPSALQSMVAARPFLEALRSLLIATSRLGRIA